MKAARDSALVAKIMATTGTDAAGARKGIRDGRRLARAIITAAETSARFHVDRERRKSGDATLKTAPAYATDGIAIPRRKRRVLLDLAPISVEILLEVLRDAKVRDLAIERVLVEALEKAR